MHARSASTAIKAIAISLGGLVAGVTLGGALATSANAITATQTVTWSDTSITNGESTSLDYVMGGISGYVAQWYDDVYVGCSWKRNTNNSFPISYESARTTTSYASTWWVGLYSTDCTATTAANPPSKADSISSTTLTMTPSGPFGPAEVTGTDTSETGVTLHWATDLLATSYLVYQDDVLVATLTAADLEYTVTGLTAGTTYSFRVVGTNDDFAGIGSTLSVTTTSIPDPVPSGPAVINVSATTETGVILQWATVPFATSYVVYQDDVLVATLTAADLEYTVTGLTAGTTYAFRVVGTNDDFAGTGSTVTVVTSSGTKLASTGMDTFTIASAGAAGLGILAFGFVLARRARQ